MSTPKKDSKASLKISDLKPVKTAKGGSGVKSHTNTVTGKTHGTH